MREKTEATSNLLEIPLFPLPNVVLFPGTLLPLRVFEPRYLKMVKKAMKSDRRIGIVLLKHGREVPSSSGKDCFSTGSVGRIAEYHKQEDGTVEILLSGENRFRIVKMVREEPYRVARVKVLRERLPNMKVTERLTEKLLIGFKEILPVEEREDLDLLDHLDFPTLVNSVCASVSIDEYTKQELLEISNLKSRAEAAVEVLEKLREDHHLVSQFQHLRPTDPLHN